MRLFLLCGGNTLYLIFCSYKSNWRQWIWHQRGFFSSKYKAGDKPKRRGCNSNMDTFLWKHNTSWHKIYFWKKLYFQTVSLALYYICSNSWSVFITLFTFLLHCYFVYNFVLCCKFHSFTMKIVISMLMTFQLLSDRSLSLDQ
jgi:hypothetical protein